MNLNRKKFLVGLFIVTFSILHVGIGFSGGASSSTPAQSGRLPDISILINESPWLEAFRTIVQQYRRETGNNVEIVGSPYGALLTRITNSLTAPQSEFDIVILDEVWANQFYEGRLVAALTDIDPSFRFDPGVLEYNWATRWDHNLGINAETGTIYGVPINGNMQILYYRTDLFEAAGLQPPKTWDEYLQVAEYFHNPPQMYGVVGRGTGRPDFGFQPILHSLGGYLLDYNVSDGTWNIGINRPEAHEALRIYLRIVRDFSPQDYTSIGQAQMISLMQSGRVPMIYSVTAAAPSFDNPAASAVVGKVAATIVPGPAPGRHAPTTGIQPFAIPNNLPDAQKRAALEFLKWVISADVQVAFGRAGGIVTRQDAWETLAQDPKFWWAKAVAESTPYARGQIRVVSGGRIFSALENILKAIIAGDVSNEAGLLQAEREIRDIMVESGYRVNN